MPGRPLTLACEEGPSRILRRRDKEDLIFSDSRCLLELCNLLISSFSCRINMHFMVYNSNILYLCSLSHIQNVSMIISCCVFQPVPFIVLLRFVQGRIPAIRNSLMRQPGRTPGRTSTPSPRCPAKAARGTANGIDGAKSLELCSSPQGPSHSK